MMTAYKADLTDQSWHEKMIYDTFVYVPDELAGKPMKQNTEKFKLPITKLNKKYKIRITEKNLNKYHVSF